jgi:SAM-dependent methyltransferase
VAKFTKGDAMALPFATGSFDAAVMALVLVFVPDPRKGVDEMARVVRPDGTVATYMWDMLGGGFPLDPIILEMHGMGLAPPRPPQMGASRMEALRDLWNAAGLKDVETREITVQRTFANFDDFWMAKLKAPSIGPTIAAMESRDVETLTCRPTRRRRRTHHLWCVRARDKGSRTKVTNFGFGSWPSNAAPSKLRRKAFLRKPALSQKHVFAVSEPLPI